MINRKLLTVALTIFSTIILVGSSIGQVTRQQTDIADISNNGSNISFIIKVPYENATLTVSMPNGKVFRKVFRAGSIPNFAPINNGGEFYMDGKFTYELTLDPVLSPGIKDALAKSRIDGDSEEVAKDFRKRGMIPEALVKSGTFTVSGSNLITGSNFDKELETTEKTEAVETKTKQTDPTTTKDSTGTDVPTDNAVVVPTDQIVQGSQCVGFDCVNGESFGFDTLRLKENNLRINFDDTSNSASFPNNDWRLVANDTSNGGANRFSIEDATAGRIPFTVEAGAPNNSLYVDDGGKIGIKTSTPVVQLHMVDGNTPTMRLEQNGSSGFSPQTWDVAGNETNFFIRDATNGSKLPFKIKPNTPTDTLYLRENGNVGIGNSNPAQKLDVNGNIRIRTGALVFADGTLQNTAATGTGGGGTISTLGSAFAQHVLGGQGIISSLSTITPNIDFNTFKVSTNNQAGVAVTTIPIPYNLNLSNQTAASITYQIRYRDTDGIGTGSAVTIELVGMDINTSNGSAGRSSDILLTSNSNAATGYTTVTVCRAANTTDFNGTVRGMYLNVTLQGTATQTAELLHVRVYKAATAC